MYHWITTLNRFDGILERFVQAYELNKGPQRQQFGRKLLDEEVNACKTDSNSTTIGSNDNDGGGDDLKLLISILDFTILLMENCGNRSLYHSSEHLSSLLNTVSLPLLKSTLRLCLCLALRYWSSKTRMTSPQHLQMLLHSHFNIDLDRLQKIANAFKNQDGSGGIIDVKQKGKRTNGLVISPHDICKLVRTPIQDEVKEQLGNINMNYSEISNKTESTTQEDVVMSSPPMATPSRPPPRPERATPRSDTAGEKKDLPKSSSQLSHFCLSGKDIVNISGEEVIDRHLNQFEKPEDKTDFLQQVRVAKAVWGSRQDLNDIIACRLISVAVLCYIYSDNAFQTRIGAVEEELPRDQQLPHQLAEMLQPSTDGSQQVSTELGIASLNCLEALSKVKTKTAEVAGALNTSVSHGILFYVIKKAMASLEACISDAQENEWRESVFSLIISLASPPNAYARFAEQMVSAGLISILVQGLDIRNEVAETQYANILNFFDTFVHNGVRDSFQSLVNAKGLEIIAKLTAQVVQTALEAATAQHGIPLEYKTKLTDYKIPFHKQQTLRLLLKFVAHMFHHNMGSQDRHLRNLIDSPQLLTALKLIVANAKTFGSNVWIGAVNIISSFIHSEPTSYNVVQEAGLITGILSAIAPDEAGHSTNSSSILPVVETLRDIPPAFGAICLNESGFKLFQQSKALSTFLTIFTSLDHVEAMEDDRDCAAVIGTSFDELVRHHPELKDQINTAVMDMVKNVVKLCQDSAAQKGVGAKLWIENADGKFSVAGGRKALAGSQDFRTNPDAMIDIVDDTLEPVLQDDIETDALRHGRTSGRSTSDVISVLSKFLQGYLTNTNMLMKFALSGGARYLIDLASCPCNPAKFHELSTYDELTKVVVMVTEQKPHLVMPMFIQRMTDIIGSLTPFLDHCQSTPYFASLTNKISPSTPESTLLINRATYDFKALVAIETLMCMLADLYQSQTTRTSRVVSYWSNQVNLVDKLSEFSSLSTRLYSAAIWEEIYLQEGLPAAWREKLRKLGTDPKGAEMVNLIDQITAPTELPIIEPDTAIEQTAPPDLKEAAEKAKGLPQLHSGNFAMLLRLLSQMPTTIAAVFQQMSKCLIFRAPRHSHTGLVAQRAHKLAICLAQSALDMVVKPRTSDSTLTQADIMHHDALALYAMITVMTEKKTLRSSPADVYVIVLNHFYHQGGFDMLNERLTRYVSQLRKCPKTETVDRESEAVYLVTSICFILDFYAMVTDWKNISESPQNITSHALITEPQSKNNFEISQLLVEVRNAVIVPIESIWGSDLEEVATLIGLDGVKSIMTILDSIVDADGEVGAFTRSQEAKRYIPVMKKWKVRSPELLREIMRPGIPQDVAVEALYRCCDSPIGATEYIHLQNDQSLGFTVPRLPPPPEDLEAITSPSNTEDLELRDASASEQTVTTAEGASEVAAQTTDEIMSEAQPSANGDAETSNLSPTGILNSLVSRTTGVLNIGSDNGDSQLDDEPLGQDPINPITVDDLNEKRQRVKEDLIVKCLDALKVFPEITFDVADLINATVMSSGSEVTQTKSDIGEMLACLLVSLGSSERTVAQGKQIAAIAHLLALVLQDPDFFDATLETLKDNMTEFIQLLKIPMDTSFEACSEYVGHILLVLERVLVADEEPHQIEWSAPSEDVDPKKDAAVITLPPPLITIEVKNEIFLAIMDFLPRVGKNDSLVLSIIRMLVILSRRRSIAKQLSEKQNLGRLFIMIKQLAGLQKEGIQGGLMLILRHLVEDEETLRIIMRTAIHKMFELSRSQRFIDVTSYTRHMYDCAIRDPEMFVQITNEEVKLVKWDTTQRPQALAVELKQTSTEKPIDNKQSSGIENEAAVEASQEASASTSIEKAKPSEYRPTFTESPDGVVRFLLKELSTYRDVEDVGSIQSKEVEPEAKSSSATDVEMTDSLPSLTVMTDPSIATDRKPSTNKPVFKADENVIYIYRCFILQCLVELLGSYNKTKLDFINFSLKSESSSSSIATPSKPHSGILSYLLNNLIPVGTLIHNEDITYKKKLASSNWAMSVIVALCAQTSQYRNVDISWSTTTSPEAQRSDLTFVRKFVLEQALKSLNSTMALTEELDHKYSRVLAMSDLFDRMLTNKAGGVNSIMEPPDNTNQPREIAKLMIEKNFVSALTATIADVDTNFSNAKRVIKYILRPIRFLTHVAITSGLTFANDNAAIGIADDDDISSATSGSEMADVDRLSTPDLFRNSTLAQFEAGREDDSDTDEEGDEEEEYYEDDYEEEDEMDYEHEPAPDHGEVVSDDDDDMGSIEGLPGDVGMNVEIVMDGASGNESSDDEDEETSSDDEDDEDDEDDDDDHEHNHDDIYIEGGPTAGEESETGQEGEEHEWEDEDEGEEDGEDYNHHDVETNSQGGIVVRVRDNNIMIPALDLAMNNGEYFEDEMPPEDDDEDEDEDMLADEVAFTYEPEAENDDEFDVLPTGGRSIWARPQIIDFPPRGGEGQGHGQHDHHHHHHHHRRDLRDDPMGLYGSSRLGRSRIPANGDSGANPLLQRHNTNRPHAGLGEPIVLSHSMHPSPFPQLPGFRGEEEMPHFMTDLLRMISTQQATGHIRSVNVIGGNDPFGSSLALPPFVVSAATGAMAIPGDRSTGVGRQIAGMMRDMRNHVATAVHRTNLSSHNVDPGQVVAFVPKITVARWQDEARLLFSHQYIEKAAKTVNSILNLLTPPAIEAKRLLDEKEAAEKAVQEKADAERKVKEDAERKEREEQAKKEKEAKEAEEAAARAAEAATASAAMEDVRHEETEASNITEQTDQSQVAPETANLPRMTAMVRGSEVDITHLGIDAGFLAEIPEDMREDVIMAQLQNRLEQAPPATQPSSDENQQTEFDRDFLSALPAEIQQELLRAEASSRNRRDRDEQRRARAAAATESGEGAQPDEMNNADFMAMLDPVLRQSVLMDADDQLLSTLPDEFRAEAQALFGRATRRAASHTRPTNNAEASSTNVIGSEQPATLDDQPKARKSAVQVLDKAGVATLLRLMFAALQGSARQSMQGILEDICRNHLNRAEVVSILLSILQDGSVDNAALERSFTQLTVRAKQMTGPKTPQPLKRALTGQQQQASPTITITPFAIVQQCLSTLEYLTMNHVRVAQFFLAEHETSMILRNKTPKKGKSKDTKHAHRYPVNALLALLDRKTIIDNSVVMESLANLLMVVTEPLKAMAKRLRDENAKAASEAKTDQSAEEAAASTVNDTIQEAAEQQTNTEPTTETAAMDVTEPSTEMTTAKTEENKVDDKKKARQVKFPEIPDEHLSLVINIIAARECNGRTFQNTLEIISQLSFIPGTRQVFGRELIRRAKELAQEVLHDLTDLPGQISEAKSSIDMQGRALSSLSASGSHQNRLLRVMLALDYMFDPKRAQNHQDGLGDDIIVGLYEDETFYSLWSMLSDSLTAIREKGTMNNVATILQPSIEAFMVVCKNTLGKSPSQQIEKLFFSFTENHRKILNDLVRHNPKLMSGTFDILVANSKVLEFDNKRNFFNRKLHVRSSQERSNHGSLQLHIRRSEVFLDSFKALFFKKPNEIKYGKLNIRFAGEEGVDAGGVTREWFGALSRQMFNPNYALFNPVSSDRTTFHPNPLSEINEQHLTFFKFIGRIIGKALYEGRVLDCHFSRAVYKRILDKSVSLKDMETVDLEYYKSLVWMLENDITDVAFETFSVDQDRFGESQVIDLIENGRNIPVTQDNKHEYVRLVVEQRLTKSVEEQLEHFLIGFREIVPLDLISIFNEQELELLISGLPDIDVDDWKNNTEYHNYTSKSPQVQWFWRAVRSFDKEEKAKLLQFVTGTSKVPLNGFKELEGMNGVTKFNIHRDFGDKERLPSSHTCFNRKSFPPEY